MMPLHPPENSADAETRVQMYERAKQELRKTDFADDDRLWEMMFFVMYADPNKWEYVARFDPELTSCNAYGHVCPVFFFGCHDGETKELRNSSRKIPRDVMFQV